MSFAQRKFIVCPENRELSEREWRITRLVSQGLKNEEIASEIGTTHHVVKNYIRVVYDKTGMGSRLELALWYVSREVK
jgi:DNA-binding NarL/FixJ family response regulator